MEEATTPRPGREEAAEARLEEAVVAAMAGEAVEAGLEGGLA